MKITISIKGIPEIETIDPIPEDVANAVKVVLQKWRKYVAVELGHNVEGECYEIDALAIEARKGRI